MLHNSTRELLESPPSPLQSPRGSPRFAQTLPRNFGAAPGTPLPSSGGSWTKTLPSGSFTARSWWRPELAKTSIQLVEKSKADTEKFRIWPKHGGRANTPLSYWKEETSTAPFGRSTPTAGLGETGFRSLLAVSMNQLASGFSHQAGYARNLDGGWISNQDGELRGHVEGDQFYWACDGSSSPLRLSGERQETLCLWLDGCRHFAVLSMDGRRMVWADGDVWERAETIDPALQEAVKVQCGQWMPSHANLCWDKWKLHWRPNCDAPAWPRPTSRLRRGERQAESPSVSMVSHVMPTVPPLRGMIIIRR